MPANAMYGLYIHVPFCLRKCSYCAFYSVALDDEGPLLAGYLQALDRELALLPSGFAPATIYLGGGTPTALPEASLKKLLGIIKKRISTNSVVEWSCEANPRTLNEGKISLLASAGVNRFSLGIQSFASRDLELLGRLHSADEARQAFQLIREYGCRNISIDLIYGLPGMTIKDLQYNIDQAIALGPEHISAYGLSLEEGTPLTQAVAAGTTKAIPSDNSCARQYHLLRRLLISAGYEHYEISNFARHGYACQHNLLYWQGGDYCGCGPGAHSHWHGERYANKADLPKYIAALKQDQSPREFSERLEPKDKARELLVMGLRLISGIEESEYRKKTGYSWDDLCGPAIKKLRELKLLKISQQRLQLATQALFISNYVFRELI